MLESNKTFKTFIGHLFKTTQKMQGTTRDSQSASDLHIHRS